MKTPKLIAGLVVWLALCGFGGQGSQGNNGGSPTDWFNVKTQYGAKGDGIKRNDGAQAAVWTNGTSTTPTTPALTTSLNNEVLLSIYGYGAANTPPAGPTPRFTEPFIANVYGSSLGETAVPTAGTVTGTIAASQTSAGWDAGSVALVGTTGNTPTFVNATHNHNASGSSLVLNVPSGTTDGMTMLAVLASSTAPPLAVSGWKTLSQVAVGGSVELSLFMRTASSEPASYTFTCTGTCYPSGGIVTYSNVGAIDDPLTSATGTWAATDVGKPICRTITVSYKEGCGTIGNVLSATSVLTTFINPSTSALSSEEYRYATDDSAAFTAALAAVGVTGGVLHIPAGNYGLTQSLAYAGNYAIVIEGDGATLGNWHYASANPISNTTGLWWLTNELTASALKFSTSSTWDYSGEIRNLQMDCGAGYTRACGNQDGLELSVTQHINLKNFNVSNFGLNCIELDGSSVGVLAIENVRTQFCGSNNGTANPAAGSGLKLNSNNLQNVRVTESEFQDNQGCGINFAQWGTFAGNVHIDNSIIQSNNIAGSSTNYASICARAALYGQLVLTSDWFDTGGLGNVFITTEQPNLAGTTIEGSYSVQNQSQLPPIVYAAAGPVLPTCDTHWRHGAPACVSDASASTIGTTYTPNAAAGAVAVSVQCNGTNWLTTGSNAGCY